MISFCSRESRLRNRLAFLIAHCQSCPSWRIMSPLIKLQGQIFQYFKGNYSVVIVALLNLIKFYHSKKISFEISDQKISKYTTLFESLDFINSLINQAPKNLLQFRLFVHMWKTLQQIANWKQIKLKLQGLAQQKYSTEQIIKLLKEFRYYSDIDQNPKKKPSLDSFFMLAKLYGSEIPTIFSKVASFILEHPKHEIPLFLQNQDKQSFLTKQSVLYLFCTMTLCLIPGQHFDLSLQARSRFNYLLDFSYIFSEEQYKTKTVIEYLKKQIDNKKSLAQKMSIHRQVQKRKVEEIIEQHKDDPMCKVTFEKDDTSIEDFYGDLKADFANKFLGGGALMSGCVQEEIMFTNHPQLFTAQLLCEVMKPNQAIFLSGYKKYFRNSGYGWTAAYDGPEKHEYKYDEQGRAAEYITAIDALNYGHVTYANQFEKTAIDREILKAYCGFNFKNKFVKRVVTGNWGCGAFGGNLQTKFLIQWLACSLAKKEMIYCPFGESQKIYNQEIIHKIEKLKIGQTYALIQQASANMLNNQKGFNIYEAMKELI